MSGWSGFWIGIAIISAMEIYVEYKRWEFKKENSQYFNNTKPNWWQRIFNI